jgi:DNA-binding SARP family transcriptional activator
MSSELEVRLLGSLEVIRDGRAITIRAARLRGLLALLALSAGRTVAAGRLLAQLWNDDPPANPRRSLHTYVNRLRGLLGPVAIDTTPTGYRLQIEPDRVDVIRFSSLLAAARRTDDHRTRRTALDTAVGLWRDVPFADIDLDVLEQVDAPPLVEQYLSAVEQRTDLSPSTADPDEMISELSELVLRHPLRESLWARLLCLLDRAGRRAEALERYARVRTMIADELGCEPSPELQAVYAALLADRRPEPRRPAGYSLGPPHQLPPDLRIFSGRQTELTRLTAMINDHDSPAAPLLVVGPPGIGKTSLAIHAGHQLSAGYPDGELYVNLRGFDATEQVLDPAAALSGFLTALAPDQPCPIGLDDRAALYRTVLDDKRMLIILDNVRASDQVLPLLPSGDGCLVIITSRQLLTGLITVTGTTPLVLDLVPADDATEQLAVRIGRHRIDSEPEAAAALVDVCGGLPLALSLVAARVAAQPQLPLSALVAELKDADGDLGVFAGEVASTDLGAVFSSSYASLGPEAGRAFRLLGLAPRPDISLAGAAQLLGLSVVRSRAVLAELCRAHLLRESYPGRYATNDLLHDYAASLARTVDTVDDPSRTRTHCRSARQHSRSSHRLVGHRPADRPAARLPDP